MVFNIHHIRVIFPYAHAHSPTTASPFCKPVKDVTPKQPEGNIGNIREFSIWIVSNYLCIEYTDCSGIGLTMCMYEQHGCKTQLWELRNSLRNYGQDVLNMVFKIASRKCKQN